MLILITLPQSLPDEAIICNTLFMHGLQTLHVRKPDLSETEYERFILGIDERFRNRLVIHDFFHLVKKYGLKGIHLSVKKQKNFVRKPEYRQVSVSCHSFDDIRNLTLKADYCFLSPVFDSISKADYKQAFTEEQIQKELPIIPTPIIALGGINADNLWRIQQMGFSGAAVLGAVWSNTNPDNIVQRWRELNTPKVLSIAGFDPSSGAGITSDIKTMEVTGSYGLGVCSGITFQNQDKLDDVRWLSPDEINRQCDVLFEKNRPQFIKIGIIENLAVLNQLCQQLLKKIPEAKIIWDPILRSSSGFELQNDLSLLPEILEKIYLITPNTPEMKQLFGEEVATEKIQETCQKFRVNILWKGGHNMDTVSEDVLFTPKKTFTFSVIRGGNEKHGTGCVYSSAVTSFLAQGFSLETACNKAQVSVSGFMHSMEKKLGLHQKTAVPKPSIFDVKLMYITDMDKNISIAEQVEQVCKGGIKLVQLRMKDTPEDELLRQAYLVKSICDRYNALFIVNDNVRITRQVDADGVHLGKEDMCPNEARTILGNEKIIGSTCNTLEDITKAYTNGVDYVGVGPFRFTTTKKNLSPILGNEGYKSICSEMKRDDISLPVFAIGGITTEDIPDLIESGVHGVALSSYIKNSTDMADKTRNVLNIINFSKTLNTEF